MAKRLTFWFPWIYPLHLIRWITPRCYTDWSTLSAFPVQHFSGFPHTWRIEHITSSWMMPRQMFSIAISVFHKDQSWVRFFLRSTWLLCHQSSNHIGCPTINNAMAGWDVRTLWSTLNHLGNSYYCRSWGVKKVWCHRMSLAVFPEMTSQTTPTFYALSLRKYL